MDANTVRVFGYLLSAQASVLGMAAENDACKFYGNPVKYTEEDFAKRAERINELTRML